MSLGKEKFIFRHSVPVEGHEFLIRELSERIEGDEGFVYVSSVTKMGKSLLVGINFIQKEEECEQISPADPQHFLVFDV